MGENLELLEAWLNSKPAVFDAQVMKTLNRISVKALKDQQKEIELQNTVINALEASLSVAEADIAQLKTRIAVLEAK